MHARRNVLRAGYALLAGVLLHLGTSAYACADSSSPLAGEGEPCTRPTECQSGLTCAGGVCRAADGGTDSGVDSGVDGATGSDAAPRDSGSAADADSIDAAPMDAEDADLADTGPSVEAADAEPSDAQPTDGDVQDAMGALDAAAGPG